MTSGYGEHIEASHGYLDEQDAAAFQAAEKYLDHGVAHHDNEEQRHNGVGISYAAEDSGHGRTAEARACQEGNHAAGQRGKAPEAGDAGRHPGLQRRALELDRDRGETAHGHETLDGVEDGIFDAPAARLVFDARFKDRHHQPTPYSAQARQWKKKMTDWTQGISKSSTPMSPIRKESAEEPHELAAYPVYELVHGERGLCGIRHRQHA